jgi:hypothetical protein
VFISLNHVARASSFDGCIDEQYIQYAAMLFFGKLHRGASHVGT